MSTMTTADTTLAPIAQAPDNSALALIREAMANPAVDPAKLSALLDVRERWQASEARAAFNLAIAEFQRRCPIIAKEDTAHNKQYARIDRIWRTIKPIMGPLGLSVTWQVCEIRENGMHHLEGQLRHKDGHTERIVRDIPAPDKVSGQNAAQQSGSATTYAQRYAVCGALGIVTGEDDDDGGAAGGALATYAQAEQVRELVQAAEGVAGFDKAKFWKWLGVTEADQIPAWRVPEVVAALKRKIAGTEAKP
jgi:hypothetical protein